VNTHPGTAADLGIFARVFPRPDAAGVASAVAGAGFGTVQLNLSSVGLPTVPDVEAWREVDLAGIRDAFAAKGIGIWGVSATVNLIHPDRDRRLRERRNVRALVENVAALEPVAVTLCTGTRDPDDQWAGHPANDEPDAWRDLVDALEDLLPAAESAGVALGIEPEPGNVVSDAARAARLLEEMQAAPGRLGIVLDPANLIADHPVDDAARIIAHAVELLGGDIICLHAKDIAPGVAPGEGVVDYETVFGQWSTLPAAVPVIVQDVSESQAADTRIRLGRIADRHRWRGR
jgi:sugar phosphate isomerase/epimerase